MTSPTKRSTDELERIEARSDPLIDLVGYAERYRPASRAYDDPRFLRWVARDRREWARDPELLTREEIIALRNRILARAHADRLRVRLVATVPERERFMPAVTIAQAIEQMEREHCAAVCDLAIAAGTGRALWDADVDSAIPLGEDIPRGQYLALTVRGDSMEPLIHPGDTVLVRVENKVARNTVVVARDAEGGYVVKKVARIHRRSIELESLNPAYPLISIARVPGAVLGTVLLRWCGHGT